MCLVKIIGKNRITHLLAVALLSLAVFLFASASVLAVSAEFSQSYVSDKNLYFGSLVSLDTNSSQVVLASVDNIKNFLGVYIADSDSTIAVNKSDTDKQVAVSGKTVALASNINGPINKGDSLTVSPISGVAARALATNQIIGYANSSFDELGTNITNSEIVLSDGTKKGIVVGPIEIDLYRVQKDATVSHGLLSSLEQSIGKPISVVKLTIVALLSATLIGVIGSMSYGAIRTSIIQSSRNPLAQPVIMLSLAKIIFIIILTAIIGVSLIYLVIRI